MREWGAASLLRVRLARKVTTPNQFRVENVPVLGALDGEKSKTEVRFCDIDDLIPFDMTLEEELRTKTGLLLVAKG
jgi:hypothetical protein